MKKLAGLLMAMLLLLSQVSTAFTEDTLKQQIAALLALPLLRKKRS